MPESDYTQQDIAYIRTHVEKLERMVRFEIGANPNSRERARQGLTARPGTPEVYLALAQQEPQTQQQLMASTGLSQSTVSRVCRELVGLGFIDPVPASGPGARTAYKWNDFEELVGLSRMARALVRERSRATTINGSEAPQQNGGEGPQTAQAETLELAEQLHLDGGGDGRGSNEA